MNEMYAVIGFITYALFLFIVAVVNTYHLFEERDTLKDKFIYPTSIFIHCGVTPLILDENKKKDYRLNMKRRPPILLVAH